MSNGNEQEPGWRVNKSIDLSHLISMAGFMFLAFGYATNVERKVEHNATVNQQQELSIGRNANDISKISTGINDLRLETKGDLKQFETHIKQSITEQGQKTDRIWQFIIDKETKDKKK